MKKIILKELVYLEPASIGLSFSVITLCFSLLIGLPYFLLIIYKSLLYWTFSKELYILPLKVVICVSFAYCSGLFFAYFYNLSARRWGGVEYREADKP